MTAVPEYSCEWRVTGDINNVFNRDWKNGYVLFDNAEKECKLRLCHFCFRTTPDKFQKSVVYTIRKGTSSKVKRVTKIQTTALVIELDRSESIRLRGMSNTNQREIYEFVVSFSRNEDINVHKGIAVNSPPSKRPTPMSTPSKPAPITTPSKSPVLKGITPNKASTAPALSNFTHVRERKQPLGCDENGKENIYSKSPENTRRFLDSASRKSTEALSNIGNASSFYGTNSPSYNQYGSVFGRNKVGKPGLLPAPQGRGLLKNLDNKANYSWTEKASPLTPHIRQVTPLQGFSNLGNTCYMNAILQSLFGLVPFASDLLQLGARIFRDDTIPNKDKLLFMSMARLVNAKKRKGVDPEKRKMLLSHVKQAISSTAKRFSGFEQHDAHEFLSLVMDQCKEEVIQLNKDYLSSLSEPNTPPPAEPRNMLDDEYNNPTVLNFELEVVHTITCTKCGEEVNKTEIFHDLSVDMPKRRDAYSGRTIQDAVDQFFQSEKLEYKCEKCGHNESLVSHKFLRTPRVIVLHLKRYMFLQQSQAKLGRNISIPLYLTLQDHCTQLTQPPCPEMIREEYKRNMKDSTPSSAEKNENAPTRKRSFDNSTPFTFKHRKTPVKPVAYDDDEDDGENLPSMRKCLKMEEVDQDQEKPDAAVKSEKVLEEINLKLALENSRREAEAKDVFNCSLPGLTEDEMLKKALEQSMRETHGVPGLSTCTSKPNVSPIKATFTRESVSMRPDPEGSDVASVPDIKRERHTSAPCQHCEESIKFRYHECKACGRKFQEPPLKKLKTTEQLDGTIDNDDDLNCECTCESLETDCLASQQLDGTCDKENEKQHKPKSKNIFKRLALSILKPKAVRQEEILNEDPLVENEDPKRTVIMSEDPLLDINGKDTEFSCDSSNSDHDYSMPKSVHHTYAKKGRGGVGHVGARPFVVQHSKTLKDKDWTQIVNKSGAVSGGSVLVAKREREENVIEINTDSEQERGGKGPAAAGGRRGSPEGKVVGADGWQRNIKQEWDPETENKENERKESSDSDNNAAGITGTPPSKHVKHEFGTPDWVKEQADIKVKEEEEEAEITFRIQRPSGLTLRQPPSVKVTVPGDVEDGEIGADGGKVKEEAEVEDLAARRQREEEELKKALEMSMQDQGSTINDDFEAQMEQARLLSLEDNMKGGTLFTVDEGEEAEESILQEPPVKSETDLKALKEHGEKGHLPWCYQLMSVVSHLGRSSSTGHYISDVYDQRKKQWYSYDDSEVSQITQDIVRKQRETTGYIFFYMSKDVCEEAEERLQEEKDAPR